MYYSEQLFSSQPVTVDNTMDFFRSYFKNKYDIKKAILPGRDFVVAESDSKGVFVSVKPNSQGAILKFNAASPSVFQRLNPFSAFACLFGTKHIIKDIKELTTNTADMSQG